MSLVTRGYCPDGAIKTEVDFKIDITNTQFDLNIETMIYDVEIIYYEFIIEECYSE